MYIYSLTFTLDASIEEEWLSFMKDEHLPAIEDTGFFNGVQLARMEEPLPEGEIPLATYNLEMQAVTLDHLKGYMSQAANDIHGRHDRRFHNRFHAVDAVLQRFSSTNPSS